MFINVFLHEYFWLSFLPISFLGAGFWLLFFDRGRTQKDPLFLLFLALLAGGLSAVAFAQFGIAVGIQGFWPKVIGEEFFKMVFAILAMECVKGRFKTIAGGVVYGFSVGLGFALAENLVYLANVYNSVEFESTFWLAFQGRLWTSSLLHGITTATFGLFYAGAYLADTVYKGDHESPLKAIFTPLHKENFFQVITFHISRKHLLFSHYPTLEGHFARGVIFEGFMVACIIHGLFNMALDKGQIQIAFFIAVAGMWFLRNKVEKVSQGAVQQSKTKRNFKNLVHPKVS